MAGTLTFSVVSRGSFGNLKTAVVDIDITKAAAAGATWSASDIPMTEILFAHGESTENGYIFSFDYTSSLIMTWYFNYDDADGPMIATPDDTDVGTSRWIFYGY